MIKNLDKPFDISLAILFFSLPFSLAIPNIILGIFFLLFFFKKNNNYQIKHYFFCIALFTAYLILKSFFFKTFKTNLFYWDNLLLLTSLSFLIQNVTNKKLILKGYITGVSFSILISLIKMGFYFIKNGYIPAGNSAEINDFIFVHRPYIGFMSFLSIILIDVLIQNTTNSRIQKSFVILKAFTFLFLFLLVARLALLLTILYLILYYFKRLKTFKTKFLCVVIFLGFFALLFTNKNFSERLHLKENFNETKIKFIDNEPRFVIWNCVKNISNNKEFNIWLGFNNFKLVNNLLSDCYENTINNPSKKDYYLKEQFNTHNQFFDVFLKGGLLGLVLFILSMLLPIIAKFKTQKLQVLSIFFGMLFFCFIENIFDRQLGIYLFVFCFIFSPKIS